MSAGFAIIAFVPAALGILFGMLLQSWGAVFSGVAFGMLAPVVAFLWLAAPQLRLFSKAPANRPEELA